jgi:DMSO/TMAO reductase YedYZ molybdopterin-dependent catalytic subunit
MRMRSFPAALVLLAVTGVPALAQSSSSCNPPCPKFFRVFGQVQTPKMFDVRALQKLPDTNENVTYFAAGSVVSQTFTGALLWDLLQSVGVIVDPTIKNDILRKTIVVTGTDGYISVFTAGEIAPNFGGNQVLVAYEVNGAPLGTEGPAEIVAPGDKAGGRFVHNIATIEVRDGTK